MRSISRAIELRILGILSYAGQLSSSPSFLKRWAGSIIGVTVMVGIALSTVAIATTVVGMSIYAMSFVVGLPAAVIVTAFLIVTGGIALDI